MKNTFLTDKDREEIEAKIPSSPIVSLIATTEGVRIVVSDSNGTQSQVVKHGGKGDKGDKGDTPVVGKDYFTEADKAKFLADVIAALPLYKGEVEGV